MLGGVRLLLLRLCVWMSSPWWPPDWGRHTTVADVYAFLVGKSEVVKDAHPPVFPNADMTLEQFFSVWAVHSSGSEVLVGSALFAATLARLCMQLGVGEFTELLRVPFRRTRPPPSRLTLSCLPCVWRCAPSLN